MMTKNTILALTVASAVLAQRPNDTSICDYYTTALLKNNTAENQYTVLSLVVNTVVIGNYTQPNVGIAVPGILAPGMYNGTAVNLLPYFNGELASSNRGGSSGVSVNFLDGGGAAPIKMNMPANDTSSNQYFLLTHLYQFFGSLLGCSDYGMPGFPAYDGFPSQYEVHRFMNLDEYEVGYFIQQVGLAAESFGVTTDDAMAVGMSLNSLFGYRCAPNATAIAAQGPQQQSICSADTCPLAEGAVCDQYQAAVEPANATMSANGSATAGMPTSTGGSSSATSTPVQAGVSFATAPVGALLAAVCFTAFLI
ncbi:unnamed protein product [Discula destructiva]